MDLQQFIGMAKEVKRSHTNEFELGKGAWSWEDRIADIWNETDLSDASLDEVYTITKMSDWLIRHENMSSRLLEYPHLAWLGEHFKDRKYKSTEALINEKITPDVARFILGEKELLLNCKLSQHATEVMMSAAKSPEDFDIIAKNIAYEKNDKVDLATKAMVVEKAKMMYWAPIAVEQNLELCQKVDIRKFSGLIRVPAKKEVFDYIVSVDPDFVFTDISQVFKKNASIANDMYTYVHAYQYAFEKGVAPEFPDLEFVGSIENKKETGSWLIANGIETKKSYFLMASCLSQENGEERNAAEIYAELTGADLVFDFSADVLKKLNDAGYIFEKDWLNIRMKHGATAKFMPVNSTGGHIFSEADIAVKEARHFFYQMLLYFSESDAEKQAVIDHIEEGEARKKLIASYDKANGIISFTDSEDEAKKMAEGREMEINIDLGKGVYAHHWLIRTAVDDYAIFYVQSKGQRSQADLNGYVKYRYRLSDVDTKKVRVCWECGRRFAFFETVTDVTLPAWEGFKQRIDHWNESYCGCDHG